MSRILRFKGNDPLVVDNLQEGFSLINTGDLRQFTGLTGDNGEDIYEGDTISINSQDYTIIWDDTIAAFCAVDNNGTSTLLGSLLGKSKMIGETGKLKFNPGSLKPFDRVLMCDDPISPTWSVDIFSFINKRGIEPIVCVGGTTRYCIPYNEETKDLVGTTNQAPEKYQYWRDDGWKKRL